MYFDNSFFFIIISHGFHLCLLYRNMVVTFAFYYSEVNFFIILILKKTNFFLITESGMYLNSLKKIFFLNLFQFSSNSVLIFRHHSSGFYFNITKPDKFSKNYKIKIILNK